MQKNMKIKEILSIKDEKEVYTKAIITSIETKVSRKGIEFYYLEVADELKKTTVCLLPKHFEQEMKIYPNNPVQYLKFKQRYKVNDNLELINFINKPSIMKIKCVMSRNKRSMNYFLCNIQKPHKMTFKYKTDNLPKESSSIIRTKECIENIQHIKNYQGYIDYKFALENITLFEELSFKNINAEITLYNLDKGLIDIYKQIFEFIANGGYLIYHSGGIVKRNKPEQARRLAYKRRLLSDLKQVFHGCLGKQSANYEEEQKICSLIFDERDRLTRK